MTSPDHILLTNFTSFIEVFIGINLVFSVWDTLRKNALNNFDKKSKNHRISLQAKLGASFESGRCATKFDEKISQHSSFLSKLSILSKWIGLFISISLSTSLIYLGFFPLLELETKYAVFFVLATALPSLLLIVLGNIYVLYALHNIESFCNQQSDAIDDVKSSYRTNKT
ncbi:hypothetical protein OPFLODJI_03674 [Aeromonas hydrophila]|uniref:hypothetical protein n=1 Tax=Aeromonas TaxID=642 RepID=UPI00367228E1